MKAMLFWSLGREGKGKVIIFKCPKGLGVC